MLRPCVLDGDCSRKSADDQETYDPVDLPPGQEAPDDWFLTTLVLESLTSPNSETDDCCVENPEGLSTSFSITESTNLSKDLTQGPDEEKVGDTFGPEFLLADEPLSSDSTENQEGWRPLRSNREYLLTFL